MRVFMKGSRLLPQRTNRPGEKPFLSRAAVVALAQALDFPLQQVETPADLPGGVVDDPRIRRDIRTVERAVAPVAGRDAALRSKEIGAARLLVAPDHGAIQRQGRRRENRQGYDR